MARPMNVLDSPVQDRDLDVPAHSEAPAEPDQAPGALPEHEAGALPRIMVVDDDQGFRQMLRDLLLDEGYPVVGEASNGQEAAQLAPRVLPDIILMDLRMPTVDGIEGTRLIKTVLPLVQVIMLSAYGDPGLQRGAMEAGVYCYLIKGCPADMIKEMVGFAWRYKLSLERNPEAASALDMLGPDDLDSAFGLNPGRS